jgi:protein TonB
VSFTVDEAGRLLDAEVVKGVGYGLDEEALRLVRLMPWWTPARRAGQPVRATTSLHIRFELQ